MYGQGTSKIGEILDLGVKAGLVEKSGAWFSYDSIRIGQGRENAKTFLAENPELMTRLETAIRGRTDEVAEEMMTGPDGDDDLLPHPAGPHPPPGRPPAAGPRPPARTTAV